MNIFVTGNPRSGKSTLIRRLLDEISDKNVSGFITPEIRIDDARQGFKIIDLASKREEILASLNIKHGPSVSRYRVNVEGIDIIMDKFLESYDSSEYVIIDEIGMMEFYSKKFKETVKMVLHSDKKVVATLSKRFVKEYKEKGQVYILTRENFDEILDKVLRQIK
ncbi:MAG: NTPase [Candidatus Aminicenantes bacterium]|nr:NTPase [Candidatus Aminicenantes bacterium]